MTTSRLALRGIGRRFGSHTAVDNVSIDLAAGEFLSLLGPSGCGKTTTLRMIAGFIKPTEGTIEMNGEVLSSPATSRPPERRNMSMIFQSYAIWPHMTVEQNVAFGLSLRKMSSSVAREKVARMLEIVKLAHLAGRYPAELSGGQQQRVALARAMVIEPGVLLLDEPLSNLDAGLREEMRLEIRRLHDEFKITTVYVTHDQAEAMVTSDRVAVMNQGRVEQLDTPHAIYNKPTTRFVAGFIGRTNFFEGQVANGVARFDGFEAPVSLFPFATELKERATLSVRPQNIQLSKTPPGSSGRPLWTLPGAIVHRAYLGEYWDYLVTPDGSGQQVRVSTSPVVTFETGDHVFMTIDPALAVHLP
jgi:iron(III) transport system ATP-binding protein